jgi:hypothetical protein
LFEAVKLAIAAASEVILLQVRVIEFQRNKSADGIMKNARAKAGQEKQEMLL